MIIESEHELLALQKTIFCAKFCEVPLDPLVPVSPIVADLVNRITDELEEMHKDDARWLDWRKAETHEHRFDVLISNLSKLHGWSSQNDDEKKATVINGFAPLRAESETIDRIVLAVDDRLGSG